MQHRITNVVPELTTWPDCFAQRFHTHASINALVEETGPAGQRHGPPSCDPVMRNGAQAMLEAQDAFRELESLRESRNLLSAARMNTLHTTRS